MQEIRKTRAVVAITGASGMIYAERLMLELSALDIEIYCVQTNAARQIMKEELGVSDIAEALSRNTAVARPAKIEYFDEDDFRAPPASGSFDFDCMVVAPCSMKTLGKIANSIADNLAVRAAEVALKERRRLVIVPRETPIALTQLRNMCALAEAGAIILPACPAFYAHPKNLDDIARFMAARIMSAMGIKQNILGEWGK